MVAPRKAIPLFGVAALLLAGCGELAQHRMRRWDEPPPQVPPEPAPVAVAPAAPMAPAAPVAGAVQQVGFTTEAPPVTPRGLYEAAARRYRDMDSYVMRLRRREVVNGKSRPEELVLVKFRQEPWSVYFKWLGPEAKGREVIYVKGRPGNEIHTLTAAGDVPFFPAGQRFSIAADSPLVKSKSRYPITDAGIGTAIRRFGAIVEAAEKGDPRAGTLRLLGRVKREEFAEPVEGLEQTVPPEGDPLLPRGGRRWWYFDLALGLPVLIVTQDETGREVEYYCHDRIQYPARLDDGDFDPDRLWPKAAK